MDSNVTTKRETAGGSWLIMIAIVCLGAGLLVVGVNAELHHWAPPPVPLAAGGQQAQAIARADGAAPVHGGKGPLPRSAPASLRIPAIGVTARVISLGLDSAGGVAVPSLSTPFLASWYDRGSAPGQDGPAVLLGHVDAAGVGPAVFYKLGELVPGDLVYVTRRDRRTAVFQVIAVALYAERDFPTREVYGYTPNPTLRLITCGGDFDPQSHHYLGRTIAYAVYTGELSARQARHLAASARG